MTSFSKMSVNIAIGLVLKEITCARGNSSVFSNAGPQVASCLANINSGALSAGIFIHHIATHRGGQDIFIFK